MPKSSKKQFSSFASLLLTVNMARLKFIVIMLSVLQKEPQSGLRAEPNPVQKTEVSKDCYDDSGLICELNATYHQRTQRDFSGVK
jgi:hypothetical protein